MSIDVVRTRARPETREQARRVLDVSDVTATRIAEYARDVDDDVYFERKGARTFLVAD